MLLRLPFALAVLLPLVILRPKLPGMVEMFVIALIAFGGARLVELGLKSWAGERREAKNMVPALAFGAAFLALVLSIGVRFLILDRSRASPAAHEPEPDPHAFDHPPAPNEIIPGKWRAVSASSGYSTAALRDDGFACVWNAQPSPHEQGARIPQPIAGTGGSEAVSMRSGHGCTLRSGQALCWGWNQHGQMGRPSTGTEDRSDEAVAVAIDGVVLTSVSAGAGHTCAIDQRGGVWCWGENDFGQTGGLGSTDHGPARVPLPVEARDIEAGFRATCALGADQQVYCWGDRELVSNGSSPSVFGPEPQRVANLTTVRVLVVNEGGACALDQAGAMWCWGKDQNQTAPGEPLRQPVNEAVDIAVGGNHLCAVRRDRTVACWGENWYGQLGDGTRNRSNRPVAVLAVSRVTSISAGAHDTCAIEEGGRLVCWGRFDHGTY